MRIVPLALVLAILGSLTSAAEAAMAHNPKLLLTSKLIKRLTRDRDRQTPRWVNFENRIKNVPDSPERGFELSLYAVITSDAARAQEAVTWSLAHPLEFRQRALVLDWCAEFISKEDAAALLAGLKPKPAEKTFQGRRDCQFASLSAGLDTGSCEGADLDTASLLQDPAELYAACEYFWTGRMNGVEDQRRQDPQFFQHLPVEFLLARKPEQVEHPDWQSHVAALALVTLDPNLEASQFLQGWAIEDRQTLHDGPGVAYELLWADPYLPGIAYQNLDPWLYELEGARLFARSDWTSAACWIAISARGIQQQNCPSGWQQELVHFGTLKLLPATSRCLEIPHQDVKETVVIWKYKPGEKIAYRDIKEFATQADAAGMWRPGTNIEGKVCTAR